MSTSEDRAWIRVSEQAMAAGVRRAAVALAEEVRIPTGRLGDVAIIAMEIATNLGRHADNGIVLLRIRRSDDRVGIEIIAVDQGPGIADVTASSRDGHSTGGTLGIGLGAITRLADEMDIYSRPGTGTVLAATLWDLPTQTIPQVSGVSRPIDGEEICGDGYSVRVVDGRHQIMLCDGLGHGPLAANAAIAAVSAFHRAPIIGPAGVITFMHERTHHTRGSVVGVADLDAEAGVVRYAGIGNVTGVVLDGDGRRAMVSLPGIVGHQHRDIREFSYPLSANALVVLHSDGLTNRWNLGDYPGLTAHTPVVIAATLLRDAATRRDDAAVLVARVPS